MTAPGAHPQAGERRRRLERISAALRARLARLPEDSALGGELARLSQIVQKKLSEARAKEWAQREQQERKQEV
jgi:hypothetical protein